MKDEDLQRFQKMWGKLGQPDVLVGKCESTVEIDCDTPELAEKLAEELAELLYAREEGIYWEGEPGVDLARCLKCERYLGYDEVDTNEEYKNGILVGHYGNANCKNCGTEYCFDTGP